MPAIEFLGSYRRQRCQGKSRKRNSCKNTKINAGGDNIKQVARMTQTIDDDYDGSGDDR